MVSEFHQFLQSSINACFKFCLLKDGYYVHEMFIWHSLSCILSACLLGKIAYQVIDDESNPGLSGVSL